MDRGYLDFTGLHVFQKNMAFFVDRPQKKLRCRVRTRQAVDPNTGLRCDQRVVLKGARTASGYPDPLRRINYIDPGTDKRFVFLTNNWVLDALTITKLYKSRWQVELFLKWIKQRLRIKTFYGTSANAVKTQIWVAVSVYVLLAIVKKELKLKRSLNDVMQILSVSSFEKTPLFQALSQPLDRNPEGPGHNQLTLVDL
jgi:hypothetical protein